MKKNQQKFHLAIKRSLNYFSEISFANQIFLVLLEEQTRKYANDL